MLYIYIYIDDKKRWAPKREEFPLQNTFWMFYHLFFKPLSPEYGILVHHDTDND